MYIAIYCKKTGSYYCKRYIKGIKSLRKVKTSKSIIIMNSFTTVNDHISKNNGIISNQLNAVNHDHTYNCAMVKIVTNIEEDNLETYTALNNTLTMNNDGDKDDHNSINKNIFQSDCLDDECTNNDSDLNYDSKDGIQRIDMNWIAHLESKEISIIQYQCVLCPNIYHTELGFTAHKKWHQAMSEHMKTAFVKLDRIKIHECDFCTAAFISHAAWRLHRRKYFRKDKPVLQIYQNHDPSKPFHCEVCGWSFKQKTTLDAHSALHIPPQHACKCGVAFYLKCDLVAHKMLLNHSPEPESHQKKTTNTTNNTQKDRDDLLRKESLSRVGQMNKQLEGKGKKDCKKKDERANSSAKHKISSSSNAKETKLKNSSLSITKASKIKNSLLSNAKAAKFKNSSSKAKTTKLKISSSPYRKVTNLKNTSASNKNKDKCSKRPIKLEPVECRVNGQVLFINPEKGEYRCPKCGARFTGHTSFKNHMRFKHGWSFHFDKQCDVCGKEFRAAHCKEVHMRVHTRARPHRCSYCGKGFTQESARALHERRHLGARTFHCHVCNKAFYEKRHLQTHTRIHSGEKPHACATCHKRFSDPSALRRHVIIHTGLKPYQCEECPTAFSDSSALYRHRRMHAGLRVRCQFCPRDFASRASFLHHMRSKHDTQEGEFECDLCGKKFIFKSYLVKHIMLHMSRQFECPVCQKRFTSRAILQRHRRRHGRFVCDHCGTNRSTKRLLYLHIKNKHLGHICESCKRAFASADDLKYHTKSGCKRLAVKKHASSKDKHVYNQQQSSDGEDWNNGEDLNGEEDDSNAEEDQENRRKNKHNHSRREKCLTTDSSEKEEDIIMEENSSKNKSNYSRKEKERTIDQKFQCNSCRKSFKKKKSIVAHIWDLHEISLFCDICMKRCFGDDELQRHKLKCRRE